MKRTRSLGEFLKARRGALGLTQRSLAQKLGVEASHVAFIESGRRKPSLKLVTRIADTYGLDRQEILLLAHPEARALVSHTESEPRPRPPRSWQSQDAWNARDLGRSHLSARGALHVHAS